MSATLQREESVAELVGEEPPLPSDRDHWHCCVAGELCLTVVVLGEPGVGCVPASALQHAPRLGSCAVLFACMPCAAGLHALAIAAAVHAVVP